MASNGTTCGEILKVTQEHERFEIQMDDIIPLPPSFPPNRISMVDSRVLKREWGEQMKSGNLQTLA